MGNCIRPASVKRSCRGMMRHEPIPKKRQVLQQARRKCLKQQKREDLPDSMCDYASISASPVFRCMKTTEARPSQGNTAQRSCGLNRARPQGGLQWTCVGATQQQSHASTTRHCSPKVYSVPSKIKQHADRGEHPRISQTRCRAAPLQPTARDVDGAWYEGRDKGAKYARPMRQNLKSIFTA